MMDAYIYEHTLRSSGQCMAMLLLFISEVWGSGDGMLLDIVFVFLPSGYSGVAWHHSLFYRVPDIDYRSFYPQNNSTGSLGYHEWNLLPVQRSRLGLKSLHPYNWKGEGPGIHNLLTRAGRKWDPGCGNRTIFLFRVRLGGITFVVLVPRIRVSKSVLWTA